MLDLQDYFFFFKADIKNKIIKDFKVPELNGAQDYSKEKFN